MSGLQLKGCPGLAAKLSPGICILRFAGVFCTHHSRKQHDLKSPTGTLGDIVPQVTDVPRWPTAARRCAAFFQTSAGAPSAIMRFPLGQLAFSACAEDKAIANPGAEFGSRCSRRYSSWAATIKSVNSRPCRFTDKAISDKASRAVSVIRTRTSIMGSSLFFRGAIHPPHCQDQHRKYNIDAL